jgi:hypothetical protein
LAGIGISASPLVSKITQKIPLQTHSKVLLTDECLRVKGVDDVFAMGDCSSVEQKKLLDTFIQLFKVNNSFSLFLLFIFLLCFSDLNSLTGC